jgi:protein ImuB
MGEARAVRTMVVWCPDWPVTAAGVDPATTPAAVFHANRVVACSAAARADGVQRGIRRREAQGRCPELVVLDHDPGRDARAFEPVVAALDALCPSIEILRPGRCAFASRGPARYFGGEEALAALVLETVPTPCRVGLADGPFAALLAARTAPAGGSLVIPAGTSRTFVAPFPVTALERPELADLLQRLGLRKLGDLAGLPPAQVLARFGPDGELAHRLARGLDERPLQARIPPPDFSVAAELDPPADRVDRAAFVAKSLADSLFDELADRGLACTRILIEAETEHGEELSRLWRHDGALTAGAIAERVRWQLDGWLNAATWGDRPTSGISRVRLTPDEVRPDTGRQLGFWGGSTLNDERAARALARVQGMLGPDGVGTAVVQGGRSPAERVRFVPWGDAREAERPELEATASPWPGAVPAPAPALVHAPPLPAVVADEGGASVVVRSRGGCSGAPARLSIDGGLWATVVGWAGPWPVEERWWDPPASRRRARFQLLTGSGAAHLAAVEGGRWWIEATYD